jgi:hypothetical protein
MGSVAIARDTEDSNTEARWPELLPAYEDPGGQRPLARTARLCRCSGMTPDEPIGGVSTVG